MIDQEYPIIIPSIVLEITLDAPDHSPARISQHTLRLIMKPENFQI